MAFSFDQRDPNTRPLSSRPGFVRNYRSLDEPAPAAPAMPGHRHRPATLASLKNESTYKPDAALKADPELKSDASLKAAFQQSSLPKILHGKSPKQQAEVLVRAVKNKIVQPDRLAEQIKSNPPNWNDGKLADIQGLGGLPLKHIPMNGADLGNQNLAEHDLEGAQLKGANLRGANLGGAKLGNADMTNANLREANLSGTSVGGTKMINVQAAGINMNNTRGGAIMTGDFSGAKLVNAKLGNATIRANLEGANVSGATLPDMKDSNMKNAIRNDAKALDTQTVAEMNAGVKTNLSAQTIANSAKPANFRPGMTMAPTPFS